MYIIYESPEFDFSTPEGQDAIACCDFVVENNGIFYPGTFNDKGDARAILLALLQEPISRPASARRVYEWNSREVYERKPCAHCQRGAHCGRYGCCQ